MRRGALAGVPIFAGYVPVAVAFGLLARSNGIDVGATTAWSVLVFAGASQFIALELYAAGTSVVGIIITTLLVNGRHVLMSASVAERMRDARLRPLVAFGITDETFAVSGGAPSLSSEYMLGLELVSYGGWVAGTVVGFLAGSFVPPVVQAALGILLYALFIAILIPGVIDRPSMLIVAGSSALAHVAMTAVWDGPAGVRLMLAILAGATVGALLPAERGGG